MTRIFVDSSVVAAISFREAGWEALGDRLREADAVIASPLLEAELRAACARERRAPDETELARIEWIHPERPLRPEIERVLTAGYTTGADCWHLATALYASPQPTRTTFLTLDARQRTVAKKLGFRV